MVHVLVVKGIFLASVDDSSFLSLSDIFDLQKQKQLPFMRIEKPESIVAIHAACPLELAVDSATRHLMAWLIEHYDMSPTDAYCLISTCPDFRINIYQMVKMGNLSFVAGAEIPRKHINTQVQED